jgi:hypothetical protein
VCVCVCVCVCILHSDKGFVITYKPTIYLLSSQMHFTSPNATCIILLLLVFGFSKILGQWYTVCIIPWVSGGPRGREQEFLQGVRTMRGHWYGLSTGGCITLKEHKTQCVSQRGWLWLCHVLSHWGEEATGGCGICGGHREWHWGRFSPVLQYALPIIVPSAPHSLVQWPMYQVHSVLPHLKNFEKPRVVLLRNFTVNVARWLTVVGAGLGRM